MSAVIFARTRHTYDSYSDFWRLVELSGYPVCYVDEIDAESDNAYIAAPVNGEWNNGWQSPRARIILWQFEWNVDGEHHTPPGVSETWHIDAWQAGRIGARYVPVGSHKDLRLSDTVDTAPRYDVAMLSYMIPRRQQIHHDLTTRYGLRCAPNAWGLERHAILSQTRAMLHVHQWDDIRGVAGLRWAIAAAYELPVITETLNEWGILRHDCVLQSDYEHLAQFTRDRLRDNLSDYGMALHNLLCRDHSFRKNVEAAL